MTSGSVSRRFGRLGARTAGHGIQIFFGAVILWVAGVFLLLALEPAAGAESTDALQVAVRSSVTAQDADGFGRLFVAGTVGDDYPATVLTRLSVAGPWRTEVRELGARRELVLVSASGCVSWALTRTGDRWYLDGVPTLTNPCPR